MALRPRRRTPAGWSLAEVVIAGGLLSIMLTTSAAVMVLATRPVASVVREPAELEREELERICDLVAEEFQFARAVSKLEAEAIVLDVPTVDGVGVHQIEYRFDEDDAGRLERIVDGGTPRVLATGIDAVDFAAIIDEREGSPRLESDDVPRVLAASGAGTKGEVGITLLSGVAVTVLPALPENTHRREITAVRVRARRGASPANRVVVELRTPVGLLPGGTVLASVSIEGNLAPTSMGWMTIEFAPTIVPDDVDAISISFRTSSVLAPFVVETATASPDRDWDISYTGTLGAWLPMLGTGVTYELLGRLTLPRTEIEERVAALRMELTPANDVSKPIERIIVLPVSAASGGS